MTHSPTAESEAEATEASGTGIDFREETIDPALAKSYLAKIPPEAARNTDPEAIAQYAAAMKSGAWVMNAQPIIFDTDGRLIDGQHRLRAAIEADASFKTLVARNVRADTLHTIDQHRRRTYHGVLEARGIRHASLIVRLMGKLIRIENGIFGLAGNQIPWARYDRVLEANEELAEAARIAEHYRSLPLAAVPRALLVFMALRAGKSDEARAFLGEMVAADDVDDASTVSPVINTILIQLESARARADLDLDQSAAQLILAFNDYVVGERRRRVYQWTPGPRDLFEVDEADLQSGLDSPPKVRRYPRSRQDRYHAWNLGFPVVAGYPGLRNGRMSTTPAAEDFQSKAMDSLRIEATDSELKVEVREVTPEMARDWLDRFNTKNRRIQKSHIAGIARDIENGNWMVNAQPICFTADPFREDADASNVRLLNGQHRLLACVEADTPIEVPIAIGIDEAAFSTYDTHAKKTVSKAGASVDERVLAGAARFQWRLDQGLDLDARVSPTATELKQTLERHPGLADFYSEARRHDDLASAGIMVFVLYQMHQQDPDLAERFLKDISTGENLARDNPVLLGAKKISELRPKKGERTGRTASRKVALAILLGLWEEYRKWVTKAGAEAE